MGLGVDYHQSHPCHHKKKDREKIVRAQNVVLVLDLQKIRNRGEVKEDEHFQQNRRIAFPKSPLAPRKKILTTTITLARKKTEKDTFSPLRVISSRPSLDGRITQKEVESKA